MVTGASTAELALILIDARNGIVDQSRRHAYLSALLGIRHLVACVNKMDLVDWDEERFREIEAEFRELAERLEVPDATRDPDRGAARRQRRRALATRAPWYDGPPLLEHLETVEVARTATRDALRLPVQWIDPPARRPRDERVYAGQLAGGALAAGRRGRRAARRARARRSTAVEHPRRPARARGAAAVRRRAPRRRPRRRPRRPHLRARRRRRSRRASSTPRSLDGATPAAARRAATRSSTRRARCARRSRPCTPRST